MNIKELKEHIEDLPDDFKVIMQVDCCDSCYSVYEKPDEVYKNIESKSLVFRVET